MIEAMMLPSPRVVGVPVLTTSDPPVDPEFLMEAKAFGDGDAVFPLPPPLPELPLLPSLPV
jgi:hypothetical protein